MTYSEPERLALELQRLIERRNVLRSMLRETLQNILTEAERADIRSVIDIIDREKAALEHRLADLLKRQPPGPGGL